MKCEETKSKISFLPKGELPFDERQTVLNHVQNCSLCKNEYQEYLRMFYLIDKQFDIRVPDKILEDFSSDVMNQVKSPKQKNSRMKKIIWYAAAAVFIFIFLIPLFQQEEIHKELNQKSENIPMAELIQNEEWDAVLKKFEKKDIVKELIPVSLLIEKFNVVDSDLANVVITKKLGEKSKNFNDFIQLLKEYQRFKSRISTTEISEYLNS